MHKWDSHTKLDPLPYLELILVLACILALILLPKVTELGVWIGRQILTLGT